LKAAASVVKEHGATFRQFFADFGTSNFLADTFYEEGADYLDFLTQQCLTSNPQCSVSEGGRPPFARKFVLDSTQTTTERQSHRIDHLGTKYVLIRAGSDVTSAAFLNLKINAPAPTNGAAVTLILFDSSGTPTARTLDLDENGNGNEVVPFGTVSKAVLVLSNGSTRMACGRQKPQVGTACQGVAKHDDAPFIYTATLID
jgi:hypothetical protein